MFTSPRDNWERLVVAVVKRQQIWELCHQDSRSPSICSIVTSDDLSEQSLSFSGSNFEPFSVPPSPLLPPKNSSINSQASNELKSEETVPPRDGFSHGPQKSITDQSIQNVVEIKYKEITKATKNFRPDLLLGEGGFGPVFKGWIHEHNLTAVKPGTGIAVAVKKLRPESLQGHEEWSNEVKYLSRLRHPNLVKLIGYCIEKEERILVYEFMPKGSLESHLFTKRHYPHYPLPWATRINVAIGAARGLSFLHELERPVIHRDVKSRNILLDGEFNAKLSNFGFSKDGPIGDMSHVSSQVRGTIGYIAPEYWMTGCLYLKSDAYGFGVVLLELLSGRPAIDMNWLEEERNLVEWAKPYLGYKTKLSRIMDTRLDGQYPHDEAYTVAKLAKKCLRINPKHRPSMAEVVVALEQLLLKTL